MAQYTVLRVYLAAIDHDRFHLAAHCLAFRFEVVADVIGDGCFASPGHSVEGHVARNVTFEGFPKVVGYLLNLFLTVRQLRRPVIVTKVFFVFEEGFLGNELVKDVRFHANSTPYLYRQRCKHNLSQRHEFGESESPLYACPRCPMGTANYPNRALLSLGYKENALRKK